VPTRAAYSGFTFCPCLESPHVHPLSRRRALQTLAAGAAAAVALPSLAAWPDKTLRIVVTFPAGGASDIVARVMAEQLARKLGQPVVVDNRPGAGGSVGGLVVAQALPMATR
jgi:tripartite-type tricarboxylate transporter receptor subunit TctC